MTPRPGGSITSAWRALVGLALGLALTATMAAAQGLSGLPSLRGRTFTHSTVAARARYPIRAYPGPLPDRPAAPVEGGAPVVGPMQAGSSDPAAQPQIALSASGIQFGALDPIAADDAVSEPISGTVTNVTGPIQLGLALPDGADAISLVQISEGLIGPPASQARIPVVWELRWCAGGQWTDWVAPQLGEAAQTGGRGLWWAAGEHGRSTFEFELRCTIRLNGMEIAGSYGAATKIVALLPGEGAAP